MESHSQVHPHNTFAVPITKSSKYTINDLDINHLDNPASTDCAITSANPNDPDSPNSPDSLSGSLTKSQVLLGQDQVKF